MPLHSVLAEPCCPIAQAKKELTEFFHWLFCRFHSNEVSPGIYCCLDTVTCICFTRDHMFVSYMLPNLSSLWFFKCNHYIVWHYCDCSNLKTNILITLGCCWDPCLYLYKPEMVCWINKKPQTSSFVVFHLKSVLFRNLLPIWGR